MALLTVGGVTLPEPTEYEVDLQDLDSENTNRSETGLLHRDRIRAGVYKIKVGWVVTRSELKTITDAVAAAQVSVSFFDPTKSGYTSATMYASDKNGKMKSNDLWALSFSLTEY